MCSHRGIELGTSHTEGRALINCANPPSSKKDRSGWPVNLTFDKGPKTKEHLLFNSDTSSLVFFIVRLNETSEKSNFTWCFRSKNVVREEKEDH